MESQRHQGKLEDALIGILKAADLETATEISVRKEAEKLLGVNLSDLDSKRLVRRIVESFLLSTPPVDEAQEETEGAEEVQTEKTAVDNRKIASDDGDGRLICKLPGMRRVSIKKFKGTKLVSIREYYEKEGKVFPSGRGITLNNKEWAAFRSKVSDVEEAIEKMESKMRGRGIGRKHTEAETSNPSTSLASEPLVHEKTQIEADPSVFPPNLLIPIATTRFTGRNYYCWKHQMEFFLNQLKISYVLSESCPKIPHSSRASFKEISQAKTRAQKWINDDYICRHCILNSLTDQLYDQYSVKTLNARELWEDLKSSYADDFGTIRCHVNNYLQFQMIDGVSILEQVEELHRIAAAITNSGIPIDANFHVSAIISKLPPSWKHVRAKLMQQDGLPLDKLIYQLKNEEDSRNQQKRESVCKKNNNSGQKRKDIKVLCFGCHKEGHIRRDCPLMRSNQKDQNQDGATFHGDRSKKPRER